MKDFKLRMIVHTAMLAALTCVSTMVVRIPSPIGGYVNLGDCFVLLSGWILGPIYGPVAAGTGSMMADLLSGYAHYAPGTLVIKAGMAVLAALVCLFFQKRGLSSRLSWPAGGILAEIFMILGYFAYSSIILGKGLVAASSIPGNLIQGLCGILSAYLVMELLARNRQVAGFMGITSPGRKNKP